MSQLHTRLLQELQNQRTEYSIIRKETREEFNQYIEELRQERRQCHTLISDNQERFVNLVRDLCADLTSKLTTEESAATPGSRSSEGGGGDSSPQTMETV
ncbi:hypothetical protein IWQ62_004215 [Dispira parvispora]|uniref:Uncharacterized protein n=1 Tax=Dispira parvispora TaxID=1520584 RepID=A0A9W8E5T9_9FUNG|nr:hypothetical protein IWQ62_004215 [Dispira parvispora]